MIDWDKYPERDESAHNYTSETDLKQYDWVFDDEN